MVAPSKIMIAQVWGTSILSIILLCVWLPNLTLYLSQRLIAAFLVATQGEPMHFSTR